MRKSFFIVMSIGLLAPIVSAQPGPQPADEPARTNASNTPYGSYSGGEAGMEGGYGRGGGGYGRGGYEGGGMEMGGYGAAPNPRRSRQLVDRWKASQDASERDKIEKTLRDALKSEFNARLAAHEREIKELEEKVRQLRARLNLRREKQDEIVDHRLQQILRDAQGLGWGSEGMGGGMSGYSRNSDLFAPTTTEYAPSDALQPELPPNSQDSAPAIGEPVTAPARN